MGLVWSFFLGLLAVINNFESYLSFNSGVFIFGLVMAGLLTRVLNGSPVATSLQVEESLPPVTPAG